MPTETVPSFPVPPVREDAARAPHAVRWIVGSGIAANWPAVVASVALTLLIAVFVRRSFAANDGHLVYPMDDAYSHMAIAKNLLQHRMWGFSAMNGFSSGGSSLLWPVLLAACFAVVGVHEWVPLLLNLVAGVGLFFYAGMMIRRHTRSGVAGLFILLAMMYLTALPTITATGMEHCWQILICLVFLDLASTALSDDAPANSVSRTWLVLPILALLMTMVRYEGLFLVGVVCVLLLYRRQRRLAILCGVGGGLPIAAFGFYAMLKGWHFLPNSLLLKADISPLSATDDFLTKGYHALIVNPHMFVLVLGLMGALLVQWHRYGSQWKRPTLLLSMLLIGTLLHLQFADIGWFYRYEGYMLAIGLLALSFVLLDEGHAALASLRPRFEQSQHLAVLALAAVFFCLPLWTRAANAWNELPLASHNIYEQQYQMAHLVRQSYRNEGVAVNDIGAVDFFANVGLVDLWGLGTLEVADAKRSQTYRADLVHRLIVKRNVQVIMVDPQMMLQYGGPLAEWVPVGQWTMPDNFMCGNPTLCFFAPDATLVPKLIDALQTYAPHLPPGIRQTGLYCGERLPHVEGVYPPEQDGGGIFYWSGRAAQFALYPSDERPDVADVDSTLELTVRTLSKGLSLDVSLNGRVIASHHNAPDEVGKWVKISAPVHWREGFNVLTLMAHGGQVVTSAGDNRALLFAIHEPKWTFEELYEPGPPADDPPVK